MTIKVHALFWDGFSGSTIRGLFETRELAEKRLLEYVLDGGSITGARIDEIPVEQEYDEQDPRNYPDVIAELFQQRKIQAIKNLRNKCLGMSLKEAKDAVEAVDLTNLPEHVRAEAMTLINKFEADRKEKLERERRIAEEQEQARRERVAQDAPQPFEPVEDWMYSTWLKDGEGDYWGHVGDGYYVLLNCYGERGPSAAPQPEDKIDDMHEIVDRTDETPEFESRF